MDFRQRSVMELEDNKAFVIRALPVDENVPVDLTREPRNGHEYLLRARLEAARVFAEDSFASPEAPEEGKTVEGNEHILRTRLEAVAAAERTVKKVGLGKLKRPQPTEADDRGDVRKTKQDGRRNEGGAKPDGRNDERGTKPDGRTGERRMKQDDHIDEKSPKQGVQKEGRKTKQKDHGGRETERSGCSKSENEDLFLGIHDRLTKNKSELQKKFPKKILPLEDKKRCCRFCLGSELYSQIYNRRSRRRSGHLPLLSYVIHLDEEEVLLLLQYCYEWYLNVGINESIARWLYALLACLDRPISNKHAFGMLESFYLSCFKGRCQDLEYPYQCFVDSLMQKLSIKDN